MALQNALGNIALDATLTGGTQKTRIVDAAGDTAGVTAGGLLQVDASGATVPVSGPLTDTQLRASAVPVSGAVTITDGSGPVTVDGTVSVGNFPATQNVAMPDSSASISIAANSTSSGQVTGLNGAGTVTVQLTGTFVATVQIQGTADGTNWVNITGSNSIVNAATGAYMASGNLTAVGMYQADVTGFSGVRVITTAYTSGTVTGTVRVTQGDALVAIEGVPAVAQSGTWTVGVTGYPTAAASADALANPTVTKVDATNLTFNGATWDRMRAPSNTLNVDTSSARTATGNGTAWVNYAGAQNLIVWINVTAVSGTSPTCVFKLQWSPDNGTTWIDIDTTNLQTTSITGVTTATLRMGKTYTNVANSSRLDAVPRQVRLQWTIGGTTPSFTFASWFTTAQ